MPGLIEPQALLLLMAKQPRPGGAKTRLVPPLTERGAADLYDAFLQDKVAQMRRVPAVTRAIAFAPAEGRGYFVSLAPEFELVEQRGHSLGSRLVNVFDWAFREGYGRAIAIDGDTPTLPPAFLRRAFEALKEAATDVVLGPCQDGGYYAIGMRAPEPSLFGVQMSTPQVTKETLARADEAGLSVHQLPEWWDVDRPEDLERLVAVLGTETAGAGFPAPATVECLEKLGWGANQRA